MADVVRDMAVGTFAPMLTTLSSLLDKGAEHARSQNLDPETLVGQRLAPDMYPLGNQVQIACRMAKDGVAVFMGEFPEAPEAHEHGLAQLKALIERTVGFIEAAPPSAFEGAAERLLRIPLPNGLSLEMTGLEYLRDWALPHFYFHVVTAYDILRGRGVQIGKIDYLRHVAYAIRQTA